MDLCSSCVIIFKNLESFMADQVIAFLESLAHQFPLTVFTFVGSIVDEVIAVVPSPFVPITAGTLVYEQNKGLMFLLVVALTGTLGKTIATLLTYYIADKLEDAITHSKIGKILGVDEDEIEKYGQYLDGTGKDEIIMIVLRALPFIPTLPVSVIAGLIKLNLWSYIFTTFIGTYLRFMFYLIVAYEGVRKYRGLLDTLNTTDTIIKITLVTTAMGWLFLFLRKRWDRIMGFFFKKESIPIETNAKSIPQERTKKQD
jgi:membrane protein DedA with SNARE-associated domain